MLAKLIKHEFKATARIFLPILGTVLVLTGAAALTVKLGGILVLPGGTGWGGPVLGLASGLLCLLTFIAMMAMMTAAVVVTIQRFYKNLLGDEGYLMFTLPVTPAQHITAKLAVGTVWTLLSLALAVLAAAALIFSIPGAAENGMTLARFSAAFRAEMGTGLWMPAGRDAGAFYYRYSEHIFTALHVHGHRRAVAHQPPGSQHRGVFYTQFRAADADGGRYARQRRGACSNRGHGCAGPCGRARRTRRRDVRRNGGRGRSAAGRLCDLFLHNALVVDKAAQSRVNWYQKEGMHHGTAAVCMPEVRKYGV